jgi:putative oxidoreductase
MNSLNRFADPVFCIARLIIGLMYACHGGQKILNFPPGGHGMPPGVIGAVGAWIELGGGFLIAFGLFARIAAFFAAGEMTVAYFMVHAKMGVFPIQNHGELAVLFCWFCLFVVFHGAGSWSLDALLFGKRSSAPSGATTVTS